MVKRVKFQNKTSGLLRILFVSLIGFVTIETVAAAQGSVCLNNPDFRFDGIKSRTCDTWVAQNAKKRCNRKDKNGQRVRDHCPSICNNRCFCRNTSGRNIMLKNRNVPISCKQIQLQGKCRAKIKNTRKTRAYELCPVSCNSCVHEFIIGGMGAAGMGAVYTLETLASELSSKPGNVISSKLPKRFLVLEAKEDMGGKVWATQFGGYKVETAAGYISGGVRNPLFCEMEKFVGEGNEFKGYDVQYKLQVNDDDGNKILGDYLESWNYMWEGKCGGWGNDPKTLGEEFIRAWYEAEAYGYWCLHEERWIELDKGDKEWCDQICTINTTEISPDNEGKQGILDLVVTDNNPCNNTGVWIPTATSDLSITDLMRVDPGPPDRCLNGADFNRFFAPTNAAGVCPARVVEYLYADKEIGLQPWIVSGREWFKQLAVFGDKADFGEERDFLVAADVGYIYLLQRRLRRVLKTSVDSAEKIVFDESKRLRFNSKITNVRWDPTGKSDVVVTYCKTERQGIQNYPCIDDKRHKAKARNFISTFPIGVLKKSLECEQKPDEQCPVPIFNPPLSEQPELKQYLDYTDMGILTKVYVQFAIKFWGDKETYFTPSNSSGYDCDAAPLIYSLDGENGLKGSAMVAIALTGERGKEAADIAADETQNTLDWVCEQFIDVFNLHFQAGIQVKYGKDKLVCSDIVDIFIPTWSNDPLSQGCWKVHLLGSAGKLNFDFPVMGNMILSGEGTCERHSGWVPGGLFSGERSARRMLKDRVKGFEDLSVLTLCDEKAVDYFDFNEETCNFDPKDGNFVVQEES